MWVKGEYFDRFDAADAAARGLLDRDTQFALFDRLSWYRALWEHETPGIAPLIVRAVSEKAQAWLFFARQDDGSLKSLAGRYTRAFRPAYIGLPDDMVKLRLLTAIAKRLSHPAMRIGRIILQPIPAEDGTAALVTRAFTRAGWGIVRTAAPVDLIADLTDRDFAAYWAARPAHLQQAILEDPETDLKISMFDTFDENVWKDYASATGRDPDAPLDVLGAMAAAEGAAGLLRIGIASRAAGPMAAQLWTVEHGNAIVHERTGIETYADSHLSHAMFERVIKQDRVAQIALSDGDESSAWADHGRSRERIGVFNLRQPSGLSGYAKERLSALVRRAPVD